MGVKEVDIVQRIKTKEGELLNPFPGLRPFGFEESHLFFGREGQSDDILLKLSENRFTAVIGASGSGKSSLMYCGLIPVLYGGFMTDVGQDWIVISTRPGNAPMANLADSIVNLNSKIEDLSDEERFLESTITNVILKSSSMGLVDALKHYIEDFRKPPNFLVLIDQFEELFRFLKREDDIETANLSASFVNLLLKSIKQTEIPVYVAITMRSDFIGDCAQFPDLTHVINKSHYLIPQMTREQQKMAIEGPIAVGGGKITRRLTQQLLNDVGNSPDQLPILQHALMRTWDYWVHNREEGEPIDLRHYVAIGRIEEALSQHANETYSELDKNEREICEVIFKSLTEKGREDYGIRRAARIGELSSIAGVSEDEIINVVEKFRKPGRSILMPPANVPLKSDTIVEISHESLMRIWDRLKNWVDEEYESAQMYRRLSDAAAMYQVGRTGLWRPPDLQLALNWQKKQQPTRAWAQRYNPVFERAMLFLETSKTAYENEQRSKELLQRNMLKKARNVAVVLGLAAVVAIIFFVFALIKKVEADEKAQEALENAQQVGRQREIAELRFLDSRMQYHITQYQTSRAEQREQEAIEAQQIANEQRNEAEQQRRIAERESQRAIQNERIAQEQRDLAILAQEDAEKQRNNVQRLNVLNIAQAMAAKSLQINDNVLRGLVAQQAYKFNKEYNGNEHDRFLYDGLYYALKNLMFAKKDSIYSFIGHTGHVRGVDFSVDGDKVYSAGTDGKLLMWDFFGSSRTPVELYANDTRNRFLKNTRDGNWLILGSDLNYIQCFDMRSPRRRPVLVQGHQGPVHDVIVVPNNNLFLSIGEDKTLRAYHFESRRSQVYRDFDVVYKHMSLSPDGKMLALGSATTGKLIVLSTTDVDQEYTLKSKNDLAVTALSFHPSQNILAVGYENGVVELFDTNEGVGNIQQLEDELTGHNASITQIKFNKKGNYLATASFDGLVQLWDFNDLNMLPIVLSDHGDNNRIWSLSFSPDPDSKYLIAGCGNGLVKIWPTQLEMLASQICGHLNRNMTESEWVRYVGTDIDYEATCIDVDMP